MAYKKNESVREQVRTTQCDREHEDSWQRNEKNCTLVSEEQDGHEPSSTGGTTGLCS